MKLYTDKKVSKTMATMYCAVRRLLTLFSLFVDFW